MPILDYIPDGYQEHGFVAARLPVHNDFRFTYRPMLIEERAPVIERVNTATAADFLKAEAEAVAPQLITWTLKLRDGRTAPITLENLRSIKPMLQQRIMNIVLGLDTGDIDPTWDYEQNDLIQSLRKEAAANEASVATTREANDLKN